MPQTLEHPAPVEKDFLPLNGTDYVEFYVGNARQAAYYYRTAFGFRLAAYRGPETGTRDRASYVLVQNKIRFVLTTPLQPGPPDRRARPPARRRRARYRPVGGRRRVRVARDHRARRAQRARARDACSDEHGEARAGLHRDLRRHHPHLRRAPQLPRRVSARIRAGGGRRRCRAPGGPEAHRPHGGQRRLGRDEPLGGFLPRRDGLPHVQALRRQGHLHRVLRADVEGDVERQRAREVPHQRAGRRASANRRSKSTWSFTAAPACSTSPWPPTTSSRRWARCGAQGVEFLRVPSTYYEDLLARVGPIDEPVDGARASSASWWTATTKATCCRSSPARWKTARRCSTK